MGGTIAAMGDDVALTQLLNLAAGGSKEAMDEVFPIVYDELRRIGHAKRRRLPAGETLRTTALVNEAFLKLVKRDGLELEGRAHFFRTAARSMRDLLVDEARRKASEKRGGNLARVELEDLGQSLDTPPEDVIALHEALVKLEAEDERDHDLVMLRYFAGLSIPEVAETLGVATRTVNRRWRFCRSWLARELGGNGAEGGGEEE